MLALFRSFLVLFLGAQPATAERLTELEAWRNPIAQMQLLVEPALRRDPPGVRGRR